MIIQRKVMEELNNCGIGFNSSHSIKMNFLSNYYHYPIAKYEEFRNKGKLLYGILAKANALYKNAILQNDTFMLRLFETGILKNNKIKKVHREFLIEKEDDLPLLFRADSPDFEHFAEFHIGLRGFGYIYALRKIMEKYFGHDELFNYKRLVSFAGMLSAILKKNTNKLTFYKCRHKRDREVNFFFKELFGQGAMDGDAFSFLLFNQHHSLDLPARNIYISPRDFYKVHVIKSFSMYWKSLIQKYIFNNGHDLIRKYKGRGSGRSVDILPYPNLLHEQKIIMALVRELKFKDNFTEEEIKLFPESYIIKKSSIMGFDERSYSLQDIVEMPRKERRFIVKYAGLDLRINWGGRAVYRLKMLSRKQTERIISNALASYEKYQEPWILQKDISSKTNIEYFDVKNNLLKNADLYKLCRPYYIHLPDNNDVELIDIMVLFRNNFKVHAKEDCAFGLISWE